MVEVKIAKVCGLCAGCKRAILTAEKAKEQYSKVVLFKEIVHNNNVNNSLLEKGIEIKNFLQDISRDDFVVLRAHGEPPETYEYLQKNNIKFADCTCFNVKKIHDAVLEHQKLGFKIVLLGKYGKKTGVVHPEVLGICGYCNNPICIEDVEDAESFDVSVADKFYAVCQTTFNIEKADKLFAVVEEKCKKAGKQIEINKTICVAPKEINSSSVELAKEVDVVIVVGGKKSSNTLELFNNVSQYCKSIFVENIYDWKKEFDANGIDLSVQRKIGITAGASTMKEELFELKSLIEQML